MDGENVSREFVGEISTIKFRLESVSSSTSPQTPLTRTSSITLRLPQDSIPLSYQTRTIILNYNL